MPFEHLVRVTLDQLPIFEGARFAFIGIAAEVARTGSPWEGTPI